MIEKILARGAEAVLIHQANRLIKRRIAKGYRLPFLDEKLRKARTKAEAKIMQKLQGKINVPEIIRVDEKAKEIDMEFIQGKKLSESLDNFSLPEQEKICTQIGSDVGKIHDQDLIHGDLTTSNMIFVNNNNKDAKKHLINDEQDFSLNSKGFKIYFIDFGLGFHSSKIEDKAVDLHLFRQALESKHFLHWEKLFQAFLSGYSAKDKTKILEQLKKVELRGRYK